MSNRIWLALVAVLIVPAVAGAVPTLQLYSPEATYDTNTQTWVLPPGNSFELWVVGAASPNGVSVIEDVNLYVSVPSATDMPGGVVSIQGLPSAPPMPDPIPGVDYTLPPPAPTYGTPPGIPPHGVFPSWYWAAPLPDLEVGTAGETVYDYQPGQTGTATGDIQRYEVSFSGFAYLSEIHFDLGGTAVDPQHEMFRFAPFSHDLAGTAVPEPGTLCLLLTGLAGGLGLRFRRRVS